MAKDWDNLPAALEKAGAVSKLSKSFETDGQYIAFTTTDAIVNSITFGIKSSGSDNTVLCTVSNGKGKATIGTSKDALFTLSALPDQWQVGKSSISIVRVSFRGIDIYFVSSYPGILQTNSSTSLPIILGHVWDEHQAGRYRSSR